jgi:hypothetical protein
MVLDIAGAAHLMPLLPINSSTTCPCLTATNKLHMIFLVPFWLEQPEKYLVLKLYEIQLFGLTCYDNIRTVYRFIA